MPLQWLFQKTKSSTKAREFQRYQGMVALTTGDIIGFSEASFIPTSAQMLLAGYAFFQAPMKPQERAMYGLQTLLALSKLTLMSAIYFEKNDCKAPQHALCLALVCVNYLYKGLLALNWFVGELNKESRLNATSPANHHHHHHHTHHHARPRNMFHHVATTDRNDLQPEQPNSAGQVAPLELTEYSKICNSV